MGFTLRFCVHYIYPKSFERFSFNFTQMFLSVWCCVETLTQLCRHKIKSHFKVMGFTLQFCVHYIYPKSFERFSLNFTQMFLSVWCCVETLTQLCRHKIKVTLQCHGIYSPISYTLHISGTLWTIFIKLHSNVPISEMMCRALDSATQTQGHHGDTWRSQDSAAGDIAVLQTAILWNKESHSQNHWRFGNDKRSFNLSYSVIRILSAYVFWGIWKKNTCKPCWNFYNEPMG